MTKRIDISFKDYVCIIGGGAAGLMSACIAAMYGASVVVFEKNKSNKPLDSERCFDNAYLGKKLLITGKGRCNLTNDCTREEFMKNVPRNNKFLYAAYSSFGSADVIKFFEDRGLSLKTERGGRVFPVSDKSLDVLKALKSELKMLGCKFVNCEITDIISTDEGVSELHTEECVYTVSRVILCTGGLSYPVTGSDGKGMRFAEKLGHTIVAPRPSLVPLISPDKNCKRLQGLSLRNVKLLLCDKNGKEVFSELGEMMFTHFGVTGPLVLSASAHIDSSPADYSLYIDLKPGLDEKKLDDRILADFAKYQNKEFKNSLSELLPSKIIPIIVEMSGIPADKKVNSVTKEERLSLVALLKKFPVSISDFRPIDEAIITRGGINVKEISPSTMESKIVKGLYFAGEIIDVDAYTGGFNLQIAFSTAYLAAKSCAESLYM